MQLSKDCKITQVITPTNGAAGTSAIESSVIDMAGFESCLFHVQMGAITSGAVTSIKVQQGDESNLSDAADLEGTSQTIADSDDEDIFYVDVVKPMKRYIRLYVSRATQNAVVSGASAIQYGALKAPVSHGTTVNGETHVSPDEGTA